MIILALGMVSSLPLLHAQTATVGSFNGDIPAYYLNPEPNLRNMEFDPKRNLMKNLKPLEGVDAP